MFTSNEPLLLGTRLLSCTDEAFRTAERLLREGQVIGVPTETVYGLAADATNGDGIEKIYLAKGRPSNNPLIVHVGPGLLNCDQLASQNLLAIDIMSDRAVRIADQLMKAFWPGPLTLVLPRGPALSPLVARGLETVGFRMPRHPDLLRFLDRSGLVLAAPSANRSNRISPTEAQHVISELGGRIPLVLDGGPCQMGLESTIVQVMPSTGELTLLRHGSISFEDLQSMAGVPIAVHQPKGQILAPGMLRVHYAPSKPLFLLPAVELIQRLRALGPSASGAPKASVLKFSDSDWTGLGHLDIRALPFDDRLVAQELFRVLRQCDESPSEMIFVEIPTMDLSQGLWPAIWDRLSRAAAHWS